MLESTIFWYSLGKTVIKYQFYDTSVPSVWMKLMQEKSHPSVLCVCSPTYLLLRNKKKVQFFCINFQRIYFLFLKIIEAIVVGFNKQGLRSKGRLHIKYVEGDASNLQLGLKT